MADQVQVKLVGDDKAFLKTLQQLRDRFKQIQSASEKTQKSVRTGAAKSKTALNAQRNTVRSLSNAFTRLGQVGVASQKILQTQIRRTTNLLRKQLVLLKKARVIPQGTGGRGTGALAPSTRRAPTRQPRTPLNDRPQFFGEGLAPTRAAQVGDPIRNVNQQGQINQAALARERVVAQREQQVEIKRTQAAEARASRQKEIADRRAIAAEKRKTAATKRSTQAIRKQSQPLTLLVAKFALMAFAIQTVANIANSTFGAILRSIDEFETAAVGTAVAVTGITASAQPLDEVFNQNLMAARDTFEELSLVAAEFFATGQELQLAFNTLAQRGVVVREDEFRILGKLTDQIKLLTGGQNTQIQIQQELRAILDGNIRTTTAFGKSLQARGADVGQLAKEVRATGSLEVFEAFLTGLDSATGAIRRTLGSVTATFSSLFDILQRNIFRETFDTTVSTITQINNLIIDQREQIIQIGILVVDKVAAGWDVVLDVLDSITATLFRIVSNDLALFISAMAVAGKAVKRGPLGAIIGLATAVTGVSGDASTFGNTLTTVFNLLEIGIGKLLDGLDGIVNIFKELSELISATFTGGIGFAIDVKSLQRAQTALKDLKDDLEITERQISFLRGVEDRDEGQEERLQRALRNRRTLLEDITDATFKSAEAQEKLAETEEGRELLRDRGQVFGIRESVAQLSAELASLTSEAASSMFKTAKEEGTDFVNELSKLASGIKVPGRSGKKFAATNNVSPFDPFPVQTDIVEKQGELSAIAEEDGARQRAFDNRLVRIARIAAERKLTGRQAFELEQSLRRNDLKNQVDNIQTQKELAAELSLLKLDLIKGEILVQQEQQQNQRNAVKAQAKAAIARGNLDAEALEAAQALLALGPVTEEEAATNEQTLKIQKEKTSEVQKQLALQIKILALQGKIGDSQEGQRGEIAKANRDASRQLETRAQGLRAFGGETNSEAIRRITEQGNRLQAEFAASNTSAPDQTAFNAQQVQLNINQAIKPQIEAVNSAIDATFQTLIDGLLEGAFEFRDLAQTISKDFIQSGLQGFINEIKDSVTEGLTDIFKAIGKGADDAAAGAKNAAQGLILGFGLLIAVLSRTGNKGDFEATGGQAGGGVDQSSVQTRGLIGGDTQIAIAQINESMQEAMIPTNAILTQIERNTRAFADVGALGDVDLGQLISDRVDAAFSQSLLTP